MKVTFTRTHARGYSVTVERPGSDPATMDPAPGYHERLPHDVAHFIVEDELQITGGIFGQFAARGTANTFFSSPSKRAKKDRRRGAEIARVNKKDALFLEHAIYAAQSRWEEHEIIPDTKIPADKIARIIERFDQFAAEWSKLPAGGAITLEWTLGKAKRSR